MLIDIIVIALIAVIVISRFTKFKLPKDSSDKSSRPDLNRLRNQSLLRDDEPGKGPVDITSVAETRLGPLKPATKVSAKDVQHLPGIEQIKALEPSFNEASFLEGARSAYLFYIEKWNAKDEQAIENLTAPALTARLLTQMDSKAYQPIPTTLLSNVGIESARLHGKTAVIDVVLEGLEGDLPFRRIWTLARPVASEDPNWDVQDMRDVPPAKLN